MVATFDDGFNVLVGLLKDADRAVLQINDFSDACNGILYDVGTCD